MQELNSLEEGETVEVTVRATNGELKEDEVWTDRLEYVGEQDLSAQSRKVSYEFRRVKDDGHVFIRHSARHKNNMGFVLSQEDTEDVDYDAIWQDPIRDDRDWKVEEIHA